MASTGGQGSGVAPTDRRAAALGKYRAKFLEHTELETRLKKRKRSCGPPSSNSNVGFV
jgi:hypothetical protein